MATLQENYRAGEKLVVGSLEVLQDFKSASMQRIEDKVDMLDNSQTTIRQAQVDFWSKLVEDGVITPIEKRELLREFNAEDQIYSQILVEARNYHCDNGAEVQLMIHNYYVLRKHIYNTLGVFNDMTENTIVLDKNVYIKCFTDYYEAKEKALQAIDTAKTNKISIDNAKELDEQDHQAGYMGQINSLPELNAKKNPKGSFYEGDYFLWGGADQTGITEIRCTDNTLLKGYIYKANKQNNTIVWIKEDDTAPENLNDYTTAMGDILNQPEKLHRGIFSSIFTKSLYSNQIGLPATGLIKAGNININEICTIEKATDGTVTKLMLTKPIPKNQEGFVLCGDGNAAFSGTFRGDFYSDLLNIEKKSVNGDKEVTATAGEDIFDVIQRIAETYGTQDYPINQANLTFESPQTFNGEQITRFGWNIIEETQTDHGTGQSCLKYGEWEEEKEWGKDGKNWRIIQHYSLDVTKYEYYEYTTIVYINGNTIKRKRRDCKIIEKNTYEDRMFANENMDKVREMQKGTVYENNTDLNLTDGHLLKGAVNMTLGTQQTVMHFTDNLKNDNIGLSEGDVFQDGGFLRVVTTDSNKTSKYQSAVTTKSGDTGQYYSLSYFVIGDLLLYFGETTEHKEDTSVLIKFEPYTFAFKPICVTGNVMGNKWQKTNILDLTTTYLRIRSFTARPNSVYSGKCSFLVIGQKSVKGYFDEDHNVKVVE